MSAKDHLQHVRTAFNDPHDDATHAALEALEYLLTLRTDAEQAAEEFVARSKAKTESTDAVALGNAIHQDFADMLERVKLAREVASAWEKSGQRMTAACGKRIMEILGR